MCASGGGGKCTLRDPATVEPELLARATLLNTLPKPRRNRYISVKLLDGSWDEFSREIAILQRVDDEQLRKLGPLENVVTEMDDAFAAQVTECTKNGVLTVKVYNGAGFEGKAVAQSHKPCAKALVERLRFERQYWGRELQFVTGLKGVGPLPRPEPALPVADEAVPALPSEQRSSGPNGSPASASPPADEAAIRLWLNEHGSEILACNAGEALALRVDVDADGALTVAIHGAPPGSAEGRCLEEALVPPTFAPGVGTLIHLVKAAPTPR